MTRAKHERLCDIERKETNRKKTRKTHRSVKETWWREGERDKEKNMLKILSNCFFII